MKKHNFILSLGLALAALTFQACSDESEDFKPGPEVDEACQEVHFDSSNEAIAMLFASDPKREVTYSLSRNNTTGALTVPVSIIAAASELTIPASVQFADGEATTSFVITAPAEVPEGTSFDFDIELEGTDVNPYIAAGATRFSGTISFPKKKMARMWFTGMVETWGYFLQGFYDLGNGALVAPDFLNSGTDIWVRYDANATTTVECDVQTSPNYLENDEDNPGCYFLYCWEDGKEENDGYTMFYPHGIDSKLYISEMVLYVSHDGYNASVYNPVSQSGWLSLSTVWFSDKASESYWKYINWVFTDDPETDGYEYGEPDPTALKAGTELNCSVRFNFDDYGLKLFTQNGVVVSKNNVRFDDFMGSGKSVTIKYVGDGTLEVTSDYGYVQKGVWYFRDEATSEWYDCYPTGDESKRMNFSITLVNKENVIDYAEKKMKFHFRDIYMNGKTNGFDDYLMYTW